MGLHDSRGTFYVTFGDPSGIVSEISCGKKTDTHTDAGENPTIATAVGIENHVLIFRAPLISFRKQVSGWMRAR